MKGTIKFHGYVILITEPVYPSENWAYIISVSEDC